MAIAVTVWTMRDTAPEPRPPSKARAVASDVKVTPDLVGVPLGRAMELARREGFDLYIDRMRSASAPLGTVVKQEPLQGVRQSFGRHEVSLTLAAPRARVCRTRDLAGRFTGISRAMGQVWGGAVVANRSSTPCRLSGRLRIRGLGRDGHPVTPTTSRAIEGPLVLSPHSSPRSPPPALLAGFGFGGNQRDDPDTPDGQCYDRRAPATWEVRLSTGARVRFPNGTERPYDSCHGDLHFDTGPHLVGVYGTGVVSP